MAADPCFICKKPLTGRKRYEVECYDGGSQLRKEGQVLTEAEQDQASYMGFFPVGPDCARKLKADGVAVKVWIWE